MKNADGSTKHDDIDTALYEQMKEREEAYDEEKLFSEDVMPK